MEEGTSALSNLDFSPVVSALTGSVAPTDIITLLGSIIAFGIPFVLTWFGIRKVIKIFRAAVMGGHITV